jgi:hypothetical protein
MDAGNPQTRTVRLQFLHTFSWFLALHRYCAVLDAVAVGLYQQLTVISSQRPSLQVEIVNVAEEEPVALMAGGKAINLNEAESTQSLPRYLLVVIITVSFSGYATMPYH